MKSKRIAVVGGGISGMAAAYHLQQSRREQGFEYEVTLIERTTRLGGVIRTERVDDCLLEWGPENFVAFKPHALRLARELGLGDQLIGSNDHVRRTFVVHEGVLRPLPEGMAFLSPVSFRALWSTDWISARGKLRAMMEPLIPRSRGDQTVYSFLRRRLGQEMTDKVAEPLVSAIYGGNVRQLSMASALPDSFQLEQEHGSLWRGTRARSRKRRPASKPLPIFMSLRDGMSVLVDRLEEALTDITLVRGAGSVSLSKEAGCLKLVSREFEGEFDKVILACPAPAAAQLCSPLNGGLSPLLREIPYSSTSLVYLAFRKTDFGHPLDGFGFVVPDREADVMDACTWVSSKFDNRCPDDRVLIRCAVHDGRRSRNGDSRQALTDRILGELKRLMGVSATPTLVRTTHIEKAMPQMVLDHGLRLRRVETELAGIEGVFFCGAFWGGVGIPDCVATATATAQSVLESVRRS